MSDQKCDWPANKDQRRSDAARDDLGSRVRRNGSETDEQHAAGKPRNESEQVRTDIGVGPAGTGVHQQCQATDDRSVTIRPAILGHQLAVPDITGYQAERCEHGG